MINLVAAWRHSPTHRRVWALAAPMMLCNLSVPMVALVDSAVVGHLPHAQDLAAVVIGSSLYGLLVGLMGFLRMGTSGFSAQACGSGDGALLRQTLLQGLLLILLSLPFSDLALRLMQPAAELDSLAREFFYLRLLGLPAALANFALIGWLLGSQNARAPLLIMLTTNLPNSP